jgi:periplasmic protein TonB
MDRTQALRWGVVAMCAAVIGSVQAAEVNFVATPVPGAGPKVSEALDLKGYRVDGARHIYESYPHRIYKGKLPPLVHAIVVVETVLDAEGKPVSINVLRAPSHAPDVTAAVREMIRRVSPLPAPTRMPGSTVAYTETWLMDRSGRFQLDTLSEGQLGE